MHSGTASQNAKHLQQQRSEEIYIYITVKKRKINKNNYGFT